MRSSMAPALAGGGANISRKRGSGRGLIPRLPTWILTMSKISLALAAILYLIAAFTTDEPHMKVVLLAYAIANTALISAV